MLSVSGPLLVQERKKQICSLEREYLVDSQRGKQFMSALQQNVVHNMIKITRDTAIYRLCVTHEEPSYFLFFQLKNVIPSKL